MALFNPSLSIKGFHLHNFFSISLSFHYINNFSFKCSFRSSFSPYLDNQQGRDSPRLPDMILNYVFTLFIVYLISYQKAINIPTYVTKEEHKEEGLSTLSFGYLYYDSWPNFSGIIVLLIFWKAVLYQKDVYVL